VKSHKDLIVWQKAMRLAADVYRWTSSFPKHELYGLASQLQRAAVSVAANIAEGHGRGATKDYLRFLSISQGSLAELETLTLLAQQIGYGDAAQTSALLPRIEEASRILRGLQKSLKRKIVPPDNKLRS
jgi:four helix bundle protein